MKKIENILSMDLLTKSELEENIKFKLDKPYGLVTFHPVTLEKGTAQKQFKELLNSLSKMKNMKFIITKANADSDGRIINKMIDEYVQNNKERVISFTSMGQLRYLSAMKYCSLVIGNSSSGIVEAPTFKKPTINIGDRQKGRIQATSIINCRSQEDEILNGINKALNKEFLDEIQQIVNPYGDGNTTSKIIEVIRKELFKDINMKKKFYDLD